MQVVTPPSSGHHVVADYVNAAPMAHAEQGSATGLAVLDESLSNTNALPSLDDAMAFASDADISRLAELSGRAKANAPSLDYALQVKSLRADAIGEARRLQSVADLIPGRKSARVAKAVEDYTDAVYRAQLEDQPNQTLGNYILQQRQNKAALSQLSSIRPHTSVDRFEDLPEAAMDEVKQLVLGGLPPNVRQFNQFKDLGSQIAISRLFLDRKQITVPKIIDAVVFATSSEVAAKLVAQKTGQPISAEEIKKVRDNFIVNSLSLDEVRANASLEGELKQRVDHLLAITSSQPASA